jgi:hypothetical protein
MDLFLPFDFVSDGIPLEQFNQLVVRVGEMNQELVVRVEELNQEQGELNQKLGELNQELGELNQELGELKSRDIIRGDDRLVFFSRVVRSTGNHSVASRQIRNSAVFGGRCAFCGSTGNITMAHIVAGATGVDYSPFCLGYSTPLDVRSARNFLPLCGTEGNSGTCHDEFDKFRITLLYNPLRVVYTIYCLDLVNSPKADLHLRDIAVDPNFPPYRRLLAWRTRKCLLEHGCRMADKGDALFLLATFSDGSRSVSSHDEDEGDNAGSGKGSEMF